MACTLYCIQTYYHVFVNVFTHVNVDFISPVKMSEAIYDPCAYTRLNDSIVHQILMSTDKSLKEVIRSLYSHVTCCVSCDCHMS